METTKPINILLVDDNEMIRHSMGLFLKNFDDFHLVGVAANGKEAIGICEELKPDVVLMDIKMPVMNGVEATRIIQQNFADICILAFISLEDYDMIQDILSAGANSVLLKKASIDEIANKIRDACSDCGNLSA